MTLSVMQALATGLPAITTRHSAFPDQIVEGKNGYMVEEGDYKALAEKILLYLAHPETWAAMGRFGREHVKRTYNAASLIEQQIQCYEMLIAAR